MAYKRGSPIPIEEGGTNVTTMVNTDGVVYFDGTSLVTTAVGTATDVLTSNGPGMAPTFQAGGGGGSGITTLNCDSGFATSIAGVTNIFGVGIQSTNFNGLQFVASSNTIHINTLFTDIASPGLGSGPGAFGLQGYISWNNNPLLYAFAGSIFYNALGNTGYGSQMTGSDNIAIAPSAAANALTDSTNNICIGSQSFNALTTAVRSSFGTKYGCNVGIGSQALSGLVNGSNNIAIGAFDVNFVAAGGNYTGAESSNICIGNPGVNGESNVIRLGQTGTGYGQQSTCYVGGISGVTVTGAAVLVSAGDQLGVAVSSRKYKKNIEDMGSSSDSILNLRPVTFSYKEDNSDSKLFGLIAEEVAEILPELVIYDKSGDPQTVKYHELPALLLNELIKLRNEVNELKQQLVK